MLNKPDSCDGLQPRVIRNVGLLEIVFLHVNNDAFIENTIMTEKCIIKDGLTRRSFLEGTAGLVYTTLFLGCSPNFKGARLQAIHSSSNYKNGVFVNSIPTPLYTGTNFWKVSWRWMTTSNEFGEPSQELRFNSDVISSNPLSNNGLQVMWVGHSTIWIEIDGKRFLIDPMWSKRSSPIGMFGPARFFDTPIALNQVPKLDGVIISHDHADHLDYATIKQLKKTGVTFYVPLGVGYYLESWDIPKDRIKELDWWDQLSIGKDLTLIATPARHFSGRSLFDQNSTLWSSWIFKGREHKVFFSGDSGMFPGFKTIGDKYGPFDITFLEIAAYDADWENVHMVPEEAVQAHLDLKGKVMLPIHWGTFNLAFHSWTEPVERLLISAKKRNIQLSLPKPGQIVSLPEISINSYWWKSQI